ncbi:MAG TPA: DUF3105 domain-containing protein [Frankiaceae bacterium]|nr:DUF3105 domain-containing protein [Frankiaceae bacterium]
MTARRSPLLVGAIALAFALSACGSGSPPSSSAGPASIPGVRTLDFTAKQFHLHFLGPLQYAQNPPFGGAHSPVPLNCGVYPTTVPNENAVHSLEHGAVWLTYKPGVDPAPLAALTSIDQSYTLVSPYPDQSSPVVASAWGLQLGVDSPTDPRLRQFVSDYVGNGLGEEKGARCAGASPEEAVQLRDNPPQQNSSPPPIPADRAG